MKTKHPLLIQTIVSDEIVPSDPKRKIFLKNILESDIS